MAFELLAGAGRHRTTSELLTPTQEHPHDCRVRPDLSPEIESFVMRMLERIAARHPNLRDAERSSDPGAGRVVRDDPS